MKSPVIRVKQICVNQGVGVVLFCNLALTPQGGVLYLVFFILGGVLTHFCNVLLQNNGNLKKNIAEMSQDASQYKKLDTKWVLKKQLCASPIEHCTERDSSPQDLYTLNFGCTQDLGSVILSGKKITQLLIEVHSQR